MRLYPAIDIKDGQCVRLKKGLFNEVTVYSDKPYEIAKAFEESGAQFIHTVESLMEPLKDMELMQILLKK